MSVSFTLTLVCYFMVWKKIY